MASGQSDLFILLPGECLAPESDPHVCTTGTDAMGFIECNPIGANVTCQCELTA